MRNLLSLLGLAFVVFLGLGWYLDWYSFSAKPTQSGHKGFEVDFNTRKIEDDVKHGADVTKEKVGEIVGDVKDAVKKKQ